MNICCVPQVWGKFWLKFKIQWLCLWPKSIFFYQKNASCNFFEKNATIFFEKTWKFQKIRLFYLIDLCYTKSNGWKMQNYTKSSVICFINCVFVLVFKKITLNRDFTLYLPTLNRAKTVSLKYSSIILYSNLYYVATSWKIKYFSNPKITFSSHAVQGVERSNPVIQKCYSTWNSFLLELHILSFWKWAYRYQTRKHSICSRNYLCHILTTFRILNLKKR